MPTTQSGCPLPAPSVRQSGSGVAETQRTVTPACGIGEPLTCVRSISYCSFLSGCLACRAEPQKVRPDVHVSPLVSVRGAADLGKKYL